MYCNFWLEMTLKWAVKNYIEIGLFRIFAAQENGLIN